jgi:transcriptional regulator with XRE-family HTH domain
MIYIYFYIVQITSKTLIEIGLRLRKIREEKRMSQTEIAQSMKMLPNQYNKVENGKVSPSLETLTKIAEALDVSLDVIVYGYSRNNVKPEDASLSEKIEKLNTLPAEEKYIANELLNLVFARQSLKNIIGNFNDVPEELIKKQNKNTLRP